MNKHANVASTAEPSRRYKRNYYIAGFIIGVVLFCICLAIAHGHRIVGWQASVFYAFNNLPNFLTIPTLWISEGLGAAYPIIVCVLVPLFYKRYRLAWRFAVASGAAGVLMEIGKLIAKEPRPIVLLHGHLHARAVEKGLTSFPSGHAAIATALAMTAWLVLPSKWRWVSVVWIVVVMFSRMYLGVHAPVDVFGGFAIGLIVATAIQLLPERISRPLHLDNRTALLEQGF